MAGEDWSDREVDLIIADYFSMLTDELVGKEYNKSRHREALFKLLDNRTEGSVEFKHRNISAVLVNLGLPFIKGYKPLFNIQGVLTNKVIDYLSHHRSIENEFEVFSDKIVPVKKIELLDFKKFVELLPAQNMLMDSLPKEYKRPIKINYLEREQNNRILGASGEEMVIAYEEWRLKIAGKEQLADKIEWISKNEGDGAGYDILSKNENGTDRYIEVKTTKLTKETPIFFSANEYNFSKKESSNFHLYRLFDFNQNPRMFTKQGKFDDYCITEAIQFKGYFI